MFLLHQRTAAAMHAKSFGVQNQSIEWDISHTYRHHSLADLFSYSPHKSLSSKHAGRSSCTFDHLWCLSTSGRMAAAQVRHSVPKHIRRACWPSAGRFSQPIIAITAGVQPVTATPMYGWAAATASSISLQRRCTPQSGPCSRQHAVMQPSLPVDDLQ